VYGDMYTETLYSLTIDSLGLVFLSQTSVDEIIIQGCLACSSEQITLIVQISRLNSGFAQERVWVGVGGEGE
jgi:hypothetical protein